MNNFMTLVLFGFVIYPKPQTQKQIWKAMSQNYESKPKRLTFSKGFGYIPESPPKPSNIPRSQKREVK